MKKRLLAVIIGAGLVLAACGGSDEEKADNGASSNDNATTETASAGDAEKLYTQKCSSCHNADLSGGVGPNLQTIGATLTQEDIEGVIANGQGAMPPKLLEGDDAAAVAEWLANKK